MLRAHPKNIGIKDGCPGVIALAGKERELEVWIAEKSNDTEDKPCWKQTFIAKNVKNDRNNLRVPVWITDLQFLSDKEDGSFRILAVTKSSGVSKKKGSMHDVSLISIQYMRELEPPHNQRRLRFSSHSFFFLSHTLQ